MQISTIKHKPYKNYYESEKVKQPKQINEQEYIQI